MLNTESITCRDFVENIVGNLQQTVLLVTNITVLTLSVSKNFNCEYCWAHYATNRKGCGFESSLSHRNFVSIYPVLASVL
jgi:hypothetical protein